MIIGTGIDIIEVDRVAEKIGKENGFREKVFSPNEIAYCESTTDPFQHYAARFAAKEAFLKATGKGLNLTYELNQIEVVRSDSGVPTIRLRDGLTEFTKANNLKCIHLSMSHIKNAACAVVILES